MTKDEALKLALDALQNPWKAGPDGVADAIIAIKETLAQPEQDGVALTNIPHPKGAPATDDLNADALEVVELELPDEDEAVGWADGGVINWIAGKQFKHASYLYTTPPQRTWVGLTDEEIDQGLVRTNYAMQTAGAWRDGVEWAIKQLKEKNNG